MHKVKSDNTALSLAELSCPITLPNTAPAHDHPVQPDESGQNLLSNSMSHVPRQERELAKRRSVDAQEDLDLLGADLDQDFSDNTQGLVRSARRRMGRRLFRRAGRGVDILTRIMRWLERTLKSLLSKLFFSSSTSQNNVQIGKKKKGDKKDPSAGKQGGAGRASR